MTNNPNNLSGPRGRQRYSTAGSLASVQNCLTNLQLSVGGQNVLQSTLQYGHEHFLEQVNLCEQLTSSDFGISTGLINQNYWQNNDVGKGGARVMKLMK